MRRASNPRPKPQPLRWAAAGLRPAAAQAEGGSRPAAGRKRLPHMRRRWAMAPPGGSSGRVMARASRCSRPRRRHSGHRPGSGSRDGRNTRGSGGSVRFGPQIQPVSPAARAEHPPSGPRRLARRVHRHPPTVLGRTALEQGGSDCCPTSRRARRAPRPNRSSPPARGEDRAEPRQYRLGPPQHQTARGIGVQPMRRLRQPFLPKASRAANPPRGTATRPAMHGQAAGLSRIRTASSRCSSRATGSKRSGSRAMAASSKVKAAGYPRLPRLGSLRPAPRCHPGP